MSEQQGIDTLAKEQLSLKNDMVSLKQSLEQLNNKDNLTVQEEEDRHTIQEYLAHQESCDKDDCEIHQAKEGLTKNWFLKGIALGRRL